MEALVLLLGIAAALLLTAAIALTVGRRLARHGRALGVVVTGLAVPLLGIGITVALNWRDGDVPGDGPAMALAGALLLATLTLPVTLTIGVVLIRRRG